MQIIEANLFKLDLLATDIRMPGPLDGLHLAKAVQQRQPDVRIIIISAYVDAAARSEAEVRGFRVLEKPFRLPALIAAVAEEVAILRNAAAGVPEKKSEGVVSIADARRRSAANDEG